MAYMPIKIYKDRVETSTLSTTNLSVNGTITGIDASKIGASEIQHASQHASNGSDPISPEMIGAAEASQLNLLSNSVQTLSGKVDSNYNTLDNKFSNYLSLSGGKITNGNLNIENGSLSIDQFGQEGNAWISVENEIGKILFGASKDSGNKGLYDSKVKKWLVYIDNNQQVYLNGNAATATTAETCSGNAATATKLNTTGTAQVNLATSSAPVYTNGGNISLGVTGILPATNGGTGVSSLYKEGAVTPASGTITSTSYVREYPFLKLVVFSIKLENASFSKGSAISVAALSGVSGAPTNCGVSAYCSGSGTSQVISRAYMGGTNIHIYFNTDVSNKSIGISGAYITS